MREWNVPRVSHWLENVAHLPQEWITTFANQQIDGDALLSLTNDDFDRSRLNHLPLGQVKKFFQARAPYDSPAHTPTPGLFSPPFGL